MPTGTLLKVCNQLCTKKYLCCLVLIKYKIILQDNHFWWVCCIFTRVVFLLFVSLNTVKKNKLLKSKWGFKKNCLISRKKHLSIPTRKICPLCKHNDRVSSEFLLLLTYNQHKYHAVMVGWWVKKKSKKTCSHT